MAIDRERVEGREEGRGREGKGVRARARVKERTNEGTKETGSKNPGNASKENGLKWMVSCHWYERLRKRCTLDALDSLK